MEINSLFGIPAHPLLVHAAVVLVPLAAIGTAVIGLWARARRAMGWVVVGLSVAAFGAVGVAQKSGEALADHVQPTALTRAHVEMGDAVLPWALAIMGLAVLIMAIDTWCTLERAKGRTSGSAPAAETATGAPVAGRWPARSSASTSTLPTEETAPATGWTAPDWLRPVTMLLGGLALVVAIGGSVQVYRVGHSGARAVWSTTDMNGPSTGGGEDGG